MFPGFDQNSPLPNVRVRMLAHLAYAKCIASGLCTEQAAVEYCSAKLWQELLERSPLAATKAGLETTIPVSTAEFAQQGFRECRSTMTYITWT
jgi:hypothetical protein